MAILLPTSPLPKSATPTPLVFGGWQTPPQGGVEQWQGRVGNRLSLAIVTPNLLPEPDGRLWTAALMDAWDSGALVRYPLPQPGFVIGTPGSVQVDGADQLGSTLNVKSATVGYTFKRRQFFHLASGGALYVHRVTADTVVDGAGKAALPIGPMLRVSPANNDSCEFGNPLIEGKLTGDPRSWTMVIARVLGLSFTVAEIR